MTCTLVLIGTFGIAEGVRRGVFDFLILREQPLLQASELVRSNPATMKIGHTTLQVQEAVYDGQMIRFVMSVQNDSIHRKVSEEECYGGGDFDSALAADYVTVLHGFDWFTIDGTRYSITGGSGGENAVSENDGEVLCYFELLLGATDDEGTEPAPTKDFTLGIPVCAEAPIGEYQAPASVEPRLLMIPVRVTADHLLHDLTPDAPTSFAIEEESYTVTVTDAKLSPLRSAITLRIDVPDSVSEEDARRAVKPWYDAALVDAEGHDIADSRTSFYGIPAGETDATRHLVIGIEAKPLETVPEKLFVSPLIINIDGALQAEMTHAIELKKEENR